MKKITCFVMALALILGLTQCKKEQINSTNSTQGIRITLNVENGGSRHDVNPSTGVVSFVDGDKIYVGDGFTYIGTLTRSNGVFSGEISEPQGSEPRLHFYFVGGLNPSATPSSTTTSFTVDISDQSSKLPVLAYNSVNYFGAGSYSCKLKNQCALVKFPLANAAGSIKIEEINNEATINFASPSIAPTGSTGEVRLYSESDTEKWAILLPQNEITTNVVIGGENYPVTVPAIAANALDESISTIENTTAIIDLSTVTSEITVGDGAILTGTLDGFDNAYKPVKISIADGATVTLNGVAINGVESYSYFDEWENWEWVHYYYYYWAGLTCLGDATIILEGENTVTGFYGDYPGIQAGPTGTTLTIKGTGSLTASNHGTGAGIGGGYAMACGNIEIQGGVITANSVYNGASIGGGNESSCGDITISGGTVTANGGNDGAGIGSSRKGSCGNISITGGTVTATCGVDGSGIGSGSEGHCGAITITGGTIEATGGERAAGIGSGRGNNYGGTIASCGDITIYATVTSVTATKGNDAPYSIGAGLYGTCGTVTIGNVVGPITDSPYYYPFQP